jgi:hypothetical protein
MPDTFHSYRPAEGHRLPHDPFNAIIGPRPIGWISSRDAQGTLNLAPYSFFNAFNYTPPIIGFSSQGRKDSLRNIEATGEGVEPGHLRPGRGDERKLPCGRAGCRRVRPCRPDATAQRRSHRPAWHRAR